MVVFLARSLPEKSSFHLLQKYACNVLLLLKGSYPSLAHYKTKAHKQAYHLWCAVW